ncbi:MAG: type II toxin-antitoxin system RelE/ParE family toxin [Paludibacter sp.]|nr:type II toxin-antitoxin system RelE/ParE family toxin [Paludibacter sp.]MDD4073798.1 type II toxin-antitoxin system RelE/ParE family toxin [Desulfobacterales bacterium]MDD4428550.1 type II toxin-antitoxin system RelE/ParE family toxin [Paludibacter sp.]
MYRVKLTPTAVRMFNNLHPTVKKQLKSVLKKLYKNPHLGKELRDELINFRSLKIKRYRAIYQIDNRNKVAIIYAIGHRRDIYEIVTELVIEN